MFENIAAIDVGTTSVKMIKVRTGISNFQVKSLSYEDIDPAAGSYEEAVADALAKITAEDPLNGYRIISNLPMQNTIIRNITFPFSDVNKIAEAIPFEAEENVPFSIDELAMDFQSLHSDNRDEGRVLLAAARRDDVHRYVKLLQDSGIVPSLLGLEANALVECYRHFNTMENETVIQLDIGGSKSIINIVKNGHLQYTRTCAASLNAIYSGIASFMKISDPEAVSIFNGLNIDMTALDNNIQREYYKSLNLTKTQLKKIFSITTGVFENLVEQVLLTIRAFMVDNPGTEFSRILISGGGSNITGAGSFIAREIDLPIVAMPFLEEYREQRLRSQFPLALGMLLSHINSRGAHINFLKGEFIPDITRSSRKIYYLAGTFLGLTVLVLLFNLVLSFIMTSRSNSYYNELLGANYRKYFKEKDIPDDPLDAARKRLSRERKELESMTAVISENGSTLETLREILSYYKKGPSFNLKNIVINERIIRIDGSIDSSTAIDDFKEKLQQSGKYDSVSLNIKSSRSNEVNFNITIKMKKETQTDTRRTR